MKSLVALGKYLKEIRYQFHSVTPETHARFLKKEISITDPLRDLFGWSRAVPRSRVPAFVIEALEEAGVLVEKENERIASRLRFSTIDSLVFAHSAYPTEAPDSVFFGPDSYRFVAFARRHLRSGRRVLDIGCGSGVGGISVPHRELFLSDVNTRALELAAVNARINDVQAHVLRSDLFSNIPPGIETVIANPPFIMDPMKRAYRDGGAIFGTDLSVRIVEQAISYLPRGGELLLYTATCFVDGQDILKDATTRILSSPNLEWTYSEIDPDIFGSEIDQPVYGPVERLAAVGLVVQKN